MALVLDAGALIASERGDLRVTALLHSAERAQVAVRPIGVLLGLADMDDVIDASVVDIAVDGDEILTSNAEDIRALVRAAGRRVTVTAI